MSEACQFHTNDEPGCARKALPGKEFCGPHSRVHSSLEEMEEANSLGHGTAAEIAERLAMAEEPVAPKRGRTRQAPVEEAPVDPETLGGRIAERLVAMELAERTNRAVARGKNAHRREDGTTLPEAVKAATFKVRPRRARADSTRMVDANGRSLVRPGWVPRWVRTVDHLDRPTEARVEDFKDFGYEAIIDPATNKPLTSLYGVAMQAPPEQYALRVKDYSPPGALNREELYEDARGAMDEMNQAAGDEIAHWVEEPTHSTKQQRYDVSVK